MSELAGWNFGVVRTVVNGEEMFAVHEIFHHGDGGRSWTEDPITFEADSIVELGDVLRLALTDVSLALLQGKHDRSLIDLGDSDDN